MFEKVGGGDGELRACGCFPRFGKGEMLNNTPYLLHPRLSVFLMAVRSLRAHYGKVHPKVSLPSFCCVNDLSP